jgi:hypothetical protein
MRFVCTIYNHNYTCAGNKPEMRTGDSTGSADGVSVVATAVAVSGRTRREAAARAYVEHVGRQRARLLRKRLDTPRSTIAQETNCAAIAASLRKLHGPMGEGYEMDHLYQAWFILVEQAPANLCRLPGDPPVQPKQRSSRRTRLRISPSSLFRLSKSPCQN